MSTATLDQPAVSKSVGVLALLSFIPHKHRQRAEPWAVRMPLILLLVVQAILTLRLRNTAFDDEALYIDAGHDYLAHWLQGAPVPDYSSFFSGTPVIYPVFAALLDGVGGLSLVRLASLLMMMVTTVYVWRITDHLWGTRAANMAAAAFVLTASVAFVGALATFDAPTLMLLSIALYFGLTRRSYRSAAVMGLVLAVAALTKYTAGAFLPVILALTVVASHRWARATARALLGGTVAAAILLGLYWLSNGSSVREGLAFTTTDRSALLPASLSKLGSYFALDIGLVAALSLLGCAVTIRSFRSLATAATLLAGALLLPLAQLRLGEEVSFEKHLAYSALFLAPLAGRGLAEILKARLGIPIIFVCLLALTLTSLPRSDGMYDQVPRVDKVAQVIESDPVPGAYLSTSSRILRYYTREKHPDIRWDEHYSLYASGRQEMQKVVKERTYQKVVLRSKFTGSGDSDQQTAYLSQLLAASPDYRLAVAPFPTRTDATDQWLVYERTSS